MSVIQKIRNKYAKLAGGVIALALVGFILMDALSSRTSNLFGSDDSIVKVNGSKVDYVTYTQRTKEYEVLYANAQQEADENFRAQIDEMALQDIVKEKLIEGEAEKLGLAVTEAEKKDMIYGTDPDQGVKSYQPFTNPNTKAFDPQYVKLFEEQADQLDPSGRARAHWEVYKGFIVRNSLTRKYNTLFSAVAYAPKFLAQERTKQQSQMASIDYVSVPFDQVKDDDVKLDDKDYTDYMNRHKAEFYNNEASRSIQFVVFDVLPTAVDTARALGVLNTIREEFATTTDNESFVNRNSEEQFVDAYKMKSSLKSMYADSVFSQPVGAVLGPVYENETYKLFKVLDKKSYPDSVRCRHILVQTSERGQAKLSDSAAKARIDSVVAAIKGGANFVEMVQKYSDDGGSKEKGGEYTFTFEQKAGLSKEFGDFIFEEGKPGSSKLVKVNNDAYGGYHYIEVLSQGEIKPAIKLATISKALFAGDETENEVYAKATEFAGSNSNAADFDKTVKKDNLRVQNGDNIKPSDFVVYGIGPSREIIRWAYKAEVNEISPVFPATKKYVVAKLVSVNQPGLKKLDDDLRNGLKSTVMMEKKGKMIAEKFNSKKSLSEIAAAIPNGQIQKADSFRGNNSFTAVMGYAPKVVGYSFCSQLKPNTLSKGIREQSGVIYMVVRERFSTPADSTFMDREKDMLQMEARNAITSGVMEQLKKKGSIKYNPSNF